LTLLLHIIIPPHNIHTYKPPYTMATPLDLSSETILFRPSKKRKIYRQRAPSPSAPALPPTQGPQSIDELIASGADAAEVEGVSVSMAEILRLRKQRRRAAGVEFRVAASRDGGDSEVHGNTPGGEGADGSGGRFAPQTGVRDAADVDRHM